VATVFLARHGQTDWNRDRRWQGHADEPLNETGREQALQLADTLAHVPFAAIYASDLARARETAEILAGPHGLPVRLDPRLREVDVGDLSGVPIHLGGNERPLDLFVTEQPEAFEEMRGRVIAALLEIAAAHDADRVLVVTHGGPIAAAWLACGGVLGERPHVGNCDVQPYRVEGDTITRID